jgi:hypothetical protein
MTSNPTPYRGIKNPVPSPMLGGSYDIDAFWNGLNQIEYNKQVAQKNKELKNREKWRQQYDWKDVSPKSVSDWNKEIISQRIDALGQSMAKAESDGVDLSANPDLRRNWDQAKLEIMLWSKQGEEIEKTLETAAKTMAENPGNYDPEEYAKIIKTAKEKKNPGEALGYLQEEIPAFFEPEFDAIEYAAKGVIPKPDQQGRTTSVSREEFFTNTKNKLLTGPPSDIEKALKQAKKLDPNASTIDDAANYIVKRNEAEIWSKTTPPPQKNDSNEESDYSGQGRPAKSVRIDFDSKYPTSSGQADEMKVTGLRPVQYDNGKGGTVIFGSDVTGYVGQDGKWYLRGYAQKVKGQEPFDPTRDEYEQRAAAAAKYGVDIKNVLSDGQFLIAYGTGVMEDVPADVNKAAFSAAGGGNMDAQIQEWNKSQNKDANKDRAVKIQQERTEPALKENQDYLERLKKLSPDQKITDAGTEKTVSEAIKRVETLINSLSGTKSGEESKKTKETPAERAARIAKGG